MAVYWLKGVKSTLDLKALKLALNLAVKLAPRPTRFGNDSLRAWNGLEIFRLKTSNRLFFKNKMKPVEKSELVEW